MDDQNQQEKQKSGPISQGINIVNNIPMGKFGSFSRIGANAARGFAGIMGAIPLWVWIVVGIIILAVVVFAIVASGIAPGSPSQTTMPAPEL